MSTALATLRIIAILWMAQSVVSTVVLTVLGGVSVFGPAGNVPMDRYKREFPDNPLLRRMVVRPHVESGPGFFKSDPVEYSPVYLAQEYKKLFALKKKMEEENKRHSG